MRWSVRVVLVLVLLVAGSCKATIPDNHFGCDTDDDCPPEQTCVGGFCSTSASGMDAATPVDASGGDAGSRDSGDSDAGDFDAGSSDAGSDSSVGDAGCMPFTFDTSRFGEACL